jgi:acyl-CoA synthetase (AMP-forming)/AMP-acid ligase II
MNIATPLVQQAQRQPEVPALIETHGIAAGKPASERRWTFRQLDDESNRLARGLARMGLVAGQRAVLMMPPRLEFFALTFALFKLGAVLVLIDPGMGVRHLGRCLAEAEPDAFLGIPRAQLARLLLGWGRRTLRHCVCVGPRLPLCGWSLARVRREGAEGEAMLHPARPDDLAAILFTSGSTGIAKGVVYTHGIFTAQVEQLQRIYGIEPGEIDLPTFPLFGLFAPALGMTAVLPEMDATRPARVNPRAILSAVRHFGVTNLFGSPALLRRVGFAPEAEGQTLPSLRRVISAGAPVPAAVLARFRRLLPSGTEIHTPYGATEALPVASIASSEILTETASATAEGRGVCVGRPVPGMRVRIIRLEDGPLTEWSADLELPPGEIGEIVVKGTVVTASYYHRPDATALHKIRDSLEGGFWHRMGDVGYFDALGRLWFCGRKSQRVVTAERTYFTIPCEGVFNAHPQVFRTALVGVDRGNGIEPELCVEIDPQLPRDQRPDRDAASLTRFRRELAERGRIWPHTRAIRRFHIHPAFPVDIRHNAKIFRERLAVWAAAQQGGLVS